MRYVKVFRDTTAGFQPATRSVSRAGIIGSSESGPSKKFLLTKPSGDEFDSITIGSNLYNAINSFYKQPNTRECWCVRLDSVNKHITASVPSPLPNGIKKQFQLPNANVTSIDAVRIDGNAYSYVGSSPSTGEYTASLSAGTITFGNAPETSSIIEVDYSIDALQSAYSQLRNEDIAFLILAGDQPLSKYLTLLDEVELASASGRYRMAIHSLPEGQSLTRDFDDEGYRYSDWPTYLQSERSILVAHKIPLNDVNEDASGTVMGVICGQPVEQSLTLRPVNCTTIDKFTAGEMQSFLAKQVCVIDMPFSHTTGKYISKGFTLSGSTSTKYIDQMRVYDDLAYDVENTLENPNVIGKLKYNASGFSSLRAWIASVTNKKIREGKIDAITYVTIPIEALALLSNLSAAEAIELRNASNSRAVGSIRIGVDYRGAMEDIEITLVV